MKILLVLLIMNLGTNAFAQTKTGDVIKLWQGTAPLQKGESENDIPTLTAYIPEKPNGSVMVICPGGGYWMLADHEGKTYAQYLNTLGMTCFVLRYRLGQFGYRHPAMLDDASRAVRHVRANAEKYGIDPHRIGIMGSSAGGHLASTLMTHFDNGQPDSKDPIEKVSSRPDFGVLCYAVISLNAKIGHQGSKENLLGKEADPTLVENLSNEKQVTPSTPPAFVWHTLEDTGVLPENSIEFALAMRKAGVPCELHLYEKGSHGIGLQDNPPFNNPHPWAKDLAHWMKDRGILKNMR